MLRNGLRPYSGRNRVAGCGYRRISPTVQLWTGSQPNGRKRARFEGVLQCGLLWACPVCAQKLIAERANDLRLAVETHGPERVALLSLTVRHERADSLSISKKVTVAWQRTIQGKPWVEFRARFGVEGYVRALEVTHGVNGWHPHLHVLFFFKESLSETRMKEAREWISDRWQNKVRAVLGEAFVPSDERGVDLRLCHRADYISKLNLELVSHQAKHGRNGSRSHWQLAADLAEFRKASDAALWTDLQKELYRKRCLTWSRGLRERLGLVEERSDAEVLSDVQEAGDIVFSIPGATWDELRNYRGALVLVLEAAENGGTEAVEKAIRDTLGKSPAIERNALLPRDLSKLKPLPPKERRALFRPAVDRESILRTALELGVPLDAVRASMARGMIGAASEVAPLGRHLRAATLRDSVRHEKAPAFNLAGKWAERGAGVGGAVLARSDLTMQLGVVTERVRKATTGETRNGR